MKKKYCCTNPECVKDEQTNVAIALDQESVMDEQNVAQMFCPKCKSRLTLCEEPAETAGS